MPSCLCDGNLCVFRTETRAPMDKGSPAPPRVVLAHRSPAPTRGSRPAISRHRPAGTVSVRGNPAVTILVPTKLFRVRKRFSAATGGAPACSEFAQCGLGVGGEVVAGFDEPRIGGR